MKKGVVILLALLSIAGTGGFALADNATILKEIQSLKERIEELEQKLEEQESLAKRQVAKTEKNIEEKISESLEERFGTLEIHYRIAAAENLAFSPDLQYVWNPGGDSENDGIFAGMVRGEFNF